MMESDGVEEVLDGMLRAAVTAGGRLGEQVARAREQMLRAAEASSQQEARELHGRFEAEKAGAVHQLSQIHQGGWWDRADPQMIGSTYAVAQAWREVEPEAQRATERIETELRDRYQIDAANTGADPQRVYEQLQRFEAERMAELAAAEQRKEAEERSEAERLLAEADRMDSGAQTAERAAEFEPDAAERDRAAAEASQLNERSQEVREDAGLSYDSAERREATAAELKQHGISDKAIEARMLADVSQAKPATSITAPRSAPKARKGRPGGTRSRQAHIER